MIRGDLSSKWLSQVFLMFIESFRTFFETKSSNLRDPSILYLV